MPQFPPMWVRHFEAGCSNRVGACTPEGEPETCRALASRLCPGGIVEVLLAADVGAPLIEAVRATGKLAHAMSEPGGGRVLHLKGRDAQALPAQPEHMTLLVACRRRLAERLLPYGFSEETLMRVWYDVDLPNLCCLRYTPFGAWDQTPGIGAGAPIELQP